MSKPSKPKTPEPTPGERIAQVHGLIAGMRDEFDRVTKGLDEIKRRADTAIGYGLLNDSRSKKIWTVGQEATAAYGSIIDAWKIVDNIISAGVIEPEQEIEL